MIGSQLLLWRAFLRFRRVLQFFSYFLAVAKLTGEFTLLEEPTDDPDIVTVLTLLADGSSFVGSKRRIVPETPMQMLRLLIVNSIFWFSLIFELLLAKSKKAVEFMIPTPQFPTVGAN
jgi:hypothetical protein